MAAGGRDAARRAEACSAAVTVTVTMPGDVDTLQRPSSRRDEAAVRSRAASGCRSRSKAALEAASESAQEAEAANGRNTASAAAAHRDVGALGRTDSVQPAIRPFAVHAMNPTADVPARQRARPPICCSPSLSDTASSRQADRRLRSDSEVEAARTKCTAASRDSGAAGAARPAARLLHAAGTRTRQSSGSAYWRCLRDSMMRSRESRSRSALVHARDPERVGP